MSVFLNAMIRSGLDITKHTFHYARQPQSWVTALAGLSAMEAFLHLAPRVGLPRVDFATDNGTFFFPPGRNASVAGELIFYLGAVGWVSLFAALRPKIKGMPEVKSFKYGVMVYLVSSMVVMPSTGLLNPYMRKGILQKPGLFGLGLNGWKTAFSNFIGHMLFSQVTGLRQRTK